MARRVGVAMWRRCSDRPDASVALLLAALALLPMAYTSPGRVSADTKSYLTLDPGRLLSSARSMWDPSVGAGTVPHQNIGYLFPLGPYYWLLDAIGVPDWMAQRLLWAILVFAAAYGTYHLLRWLGWPVPGALVAAVAYGFSPYLLSYLARLSAILFPWAALPWLVLLASRAARDRSWARAAQFALVVALVGSVNATSLLFVGLGPVIWLFADAASRRVAVRAVAAAAGRIGVLCTAVSAWWIAGLRVQGTYGLPILEYTESYQTVASASAPQEILRGLGYWFFYGGDRLDPWIGPAFPYFNDPFVMFLGFGLAGLSLLGLFAPFRGRASMLILFLVGLTLSVGAAPLGKSTWYGLFFERFATDSTAGAALRSTPRAAPLLLLALACGLGAGVEAARTWLAGRSFSSVSRFAPFAPVVAVVAVLVNLFPWFTGTATSSSLLRPETLPAATTDLANYVNATGDGRILAIPGADFADYRWGGTVDPVLPGLTDRSVLYRELIPQGSAGTADLINAFDRRMAEGWFEPATLEPIARLLGAETVVVRNDLQHERYRLARPGPLWSDVTSALGQPDHAGPLTTDQTRITLVDEITLGRPDSAERYPVTAAFELGDLDDPADRSDLAVRSATNPVVLAGSGDGIVDLAATGRLDPDRTIVYSAGLDDSLLDAATSPWWVVTDTNRKQGHRWSSIGSNLGALEATGPLTTDDDPNDSRLDVVPGISASPDDQTIAVHLGDVAGVTASSYGSRIVYTAEDAPGFAMDGDSSTAWRSAIAEESSGLRWAAEFAQPEDLDALVVLQPQVGASERVITRIRLTTMTGTAEFELDDSSRSTPGQRLDLAAAGVAGSTDRVEIDVLADNLGERSSFVGQPGVGFAEVTPVRLDGTVIVDDRSVRLPLASTLAIAPDDSLTYLLTRQRIDPATPNRQSPEASLDRLFDIPSNRSLLLTGQARLSATASDTVLSAVLGTAESGMRDTLRATATASARLPGSVVSRGDAAVDGDPVTAWQTPFDGSVGAALTIVQPSPVEVDQISITWRNDDRHAAPTLLTVTNGPTSFQVAVPPAASTAALVTEMIPVPAFTATTTTITLDAVSDDTVPEYYSSVERTLPVGIAEISFGGPPTAAPAAGDSPTNAPALDTGCRADLITIDGQPITVRISGDIDGVLDIVGCDGAVALAAGEHRLVATDGGVSGLDIDRLALDSEQRITPAAPSDQFDGGVTVTGTDATAIDAILGATSDNSLLVLPQSLNLGWTASVDGVDLGPPMLVDGFANGWLLPSGAADRQVALRWSPQGSVDVGLGISTMAGFLILVLVVRDLITRRRRQKAGEPAESEVTGAAGPPRTLTPVGPAVAAVGAVAGFLVVGGPLAAAVAALIAVVFVVARRERVAGIIAAAVVCAGWAVVSGLIIALEWRYDYANGPDWPLRFTWAGPVSWLVVAAVSTHVLLKVLSARHGVHDDESTAG